MVRLQLSVMTSGGNFSVHGNWTEWTSWSFCDVTCANGTKARERNCTDPEPQYGGDDCTGNSTEIGECYMGPCPGALYSIHRYMYKPNSTKLDPEGLPLGGGVIIDQAVFSINS